MFEDKVVFGDFDESKNEFISIRRTSEDSDLPRQYIDEVLEEMQDIDKKKKK